MTERDLEKACMATLKQELPGCLLWKINDRVTAGIPDLEIAWRGYTTKLEFKFMKRGENIHQKWEDPRQLITCVDYERTTTRCWIVAYQKAYARENRPAQTLVYRPSSLQQGRIPNAQYAAASALVLWEQGVIVLSGFNHRGIAEIIRQTHP